MLRVSMAPRDAPACFLELWEVLKQQESLVGLQETLQFRKTGWDSKIPIHKMVHLQDAEQQT